MSFRDCNTLNFTMSYNWKKNGYKNIHLQKINELGQISSEKVFQHRSNFKKRLFLEGWPLQAVSRHTEIILKPNFPFVAYKCVTKINSSI